MDQDRPYVSAFSCIACRVAFRDLDIQRQHYKSDWHRYNLKRKVAELPPVTVEDFQKRVIAQRGKDDLFKSDKTVTCKLCRKTFSTKNQLENHILSKKHRERMMKNDETTNKGNEKGDPSMENNDRLVNFESSGEEIQSSKMTNTKQKIKEAMMDVDSDVETVDSDEWLDDNPAANNDCLFCNHHSRSLLKNLKHMTIVHSFFIPDPEYCIDPKGLLSYLVEKIFVGYLCIWCNENGKAFHSSDAARTHMIDKGHCKMYHEGESLVEYADYYDYSSSYPDNDDENIDGDEEVDIPEIDDSNYQLVLPSGNVIGHRSLMRYYKQSLDPNRSLGLTKSAKLRKVLCQYRALGWSDSEKIAVEKKARDIKYMQRIQARHSTKLQFKANKLQHHFRQQVNY